MMITLRRVAGAALAALAVACSSPSPAERAATAELAHLTPLKQSYPDVVMGFDVRDPNSLTVSLDLQHFDEMDDDVAAAMERTVVARWRTAWTAEHPNERALLHVRFIDFVGRTVAQQSVRI
ncbi:MAG TPA: hypothetical protein VGF86_07125 [Candidatus Tumulicola sp.]|jgi:hypothetical protein